MNFFLLFRVSRLRLVLIPLILTQALDLRSAQHDHGAILAKEGPLKSS